MFEKYGFSEEYIMEHNYEFAIEQMNDGTKIYFHKNAHLFKMVMQTSDEEIKNSPFRVKTRSKYFIEYIDLTGKEDKCLS